MKVRRSISAMALAMALMTFAGAADATDTTTQVRGTIDNTDSTGGARHEEFTCFGTPTCVGLHTVTQQPKGCSNGRTGTSDVTFTGFDLSRPGTFSGAEVLPFRVFHTKNPDGTCTYSQAPGTTWPLTASWDGNSGTLGISATHQDGTPRPETGTFTASISSAAAPVFPMTVNAMITPTTTTASAVVQPRPQDIGKTESLFVFAHVPALLVKRTAEGKRTTDAPIVGAIETDAPVMCILAQPDAQGNLVPVSASSMQAYFTGVLSAQAQAVTILAGASTPAVAGATFYVGYGSDAAAMFASGVYQAALSVPGDNQCTATLSTAPAPTKPGLLTGLWYNAAESGWGIHFTQRGGEMFAAWFTYDGTGSGRWYVASACALSSGAVTSGTCDGTLYQVNGPVFFGAAFNPTSEHVQQVGTLHVAFQDANDATMTYSVGANTRTVPITRQVFQTGTTPPAVDYSDLWWNPNESGWGMGISQQFGMMFLAWFVYDSSGAPAWFVAPACAMSGSSCSGDLYQTTGPAFGPSFDPTQVHATLVGTMAVDFSDSNHGTLAYTVGGATSTKAITRQLF
jgi:hypothetical protein